MAVRSMSRIYRRAWQIRRMRFLGDRKGTTAIEFAMISVPFIGLLGAILESGSLYFRSAQLQIATETASRSILTHSASAGLTYQQFVDQYLCNADGLSTLFDCSKLVVDISSPASWSAANTGNSFTAAPRSSTIAMPSAGQIAVVRVVYPVTVVTGFLGGSVLAGGGYGQIRNGQTYQNGAWTYMIMGIAAFRVEPQGS